ncbi:hypothetical protein GCM10010300_86020 [Streptomyces olivaceoviridis]|uniref:hypothetical protein n=1 Tax=Streptomyces olivaceoviridis TaxID=1921 RepID=UPI00167211C1|nr:hypothetical protein [Streptomyces olivaceoviridis]GGZ29994.1 hypothetical protein GCM10010300_86020 [Streptomyces olivaceoviridis]
MPFEATASYLQRLVYAYRLALPQLCDGAGITLNGQGTTPAAGLVLSPTATGRIAVLSRIPMTHLTRALPHLAQDGAIAGGAATARWTSFNALGRPVAACTLCTRHRSQGTTGTARVYRPWHQLVCPDPRLNTPLHTAAVAALAAAYSAHQRLRRHPREASVWMTAHAITIRWYDHQQHFTDRWRHRLHQLTLADPHLEGRGNASAVLLARDLVIYPETVTLARILATLPHRTQHLREVLTATGHRLGLTRFSPTTSDALAIYLTCTRH